MWDKIPLIPPGQRQRKSVPSRRRSDGKPPRRLVRFLWFAAKIRQSRYPLHRLRPEKRFCIQRVPRAKTAKLRNLLFSQKRITAPLLTQCFRQSPHCRFRAFVILLGDQPTAEWRYLQGSDTAIVRTPASAHVDRPGAFPPLPPALSVP